MSNEPQTIMLPVSVSTMKVFMETAQHQALMLSLKVDEQALMIEELQRQLAKKDTPDDGSK